MLLVLLVLPKAILYILVTKSFSLPAKRESPKNLAAPGLSSIILAKLETPKLLLLA